MKARCCAFILTTMDLPQIGAHCSLPSCNVLDFLPMVCQCKASFCSQHISPDFHACRAVHTNNNSTTSVLPLTRCAFEGCQKPSLPAYNETGCSVCHKSFCAECVYPPGTLSRCIHSCPAIATQKPTIVHLNPSMPSLPRVNLLRSSTSRNRCDSVAPSHRPTPRNCFSGGRWK